MGRSSQATYLRRALSLRRDPLVRGADRVEAAVKVLVAALAVVLVPVALVVAMTTHNTQSDVARAQAEQVSQVVATTLADSTVPDEPGHYASGAIESASARWQHNGLPKTGEIAVPKETAEGSEIDIWIDNKSGAVARPPMSQTAVNAAAIVSGGFTWFFVMSLAGLFYALSLVALNRWRVAAWSRELAAFLGEPTQH